MKATGEVMAIDRTFEAAFQKAIRSLEFGKKSILWEDPSWVLGDDITGYPLKPTDLRLWAVMAALRRGISPQKIFEATKIDLWFLNKMLNIVGMEKRLLSETLNPELLRDAKRLGFGDEQIATLGDRLPEQVRDLRKQWKILPTYKMVDTCAAEFDAETPYFYSTYETENEAIPDNCNKALVIGSGPIRIGQGIEFDYCSVHAALALSKAGYQSIMANSNPETVSTDFDTSNRLYFEPLDNESVRDILDNENMGCSNNTPSICQFGGQTAINLAEPLTRTGNPIIGSSAEDYRSGRRPPTFRGISFPRWIFPSRRARRDHPRRRLERSQPHRLPGAGAPQLRPGRPGHGDRLRCHRAGAFHETGHGAADRATRY